MYNHGEGVQKDSERAEYWMKKAADNGLPEGQFDYGVMCLAKDSTDVIGLEYVGKAADQGNKQAMLKYIEVVGNFGKNAHLNAIRYCNNLKSQCTDSFDIQQYEKKIAELTKQLHDVSKQENKIKRATRFSVLGSVFLVLSAIYLLGGVHPALWETNKFLKIFPDAADILTFNWLESILLNIMNINGVLGAEMLCLSSMFTSAAGGGAKSFTGKLHVIAKIAAVLIIVWHFVALIQEGRSFFTAFGWLILLVIIMLLLGKILGMILGKIFGLKK